MKQLWIIIGLLCVNFCASVQTVSSALDSLLMDTKYVYLTEDKDFVQMFNQMEDGHGDVIVQQSLQDKLYTIHSIRVLKLVNVAKNSLDTVTNKRAFKKNVLQELETVRLDAETDMTSEDYDEFKFVIKMMRFIVRMM